MIPVFDAVTPSLTVVEALFAMTVGATLRMVISVVSSKNPPSLSSTRPRTIRTPGPSAR